MTPYAEALLWMAASLGGGDVTLVDPRDASVHYVEAYDYHTSFARYYGLRIHSFDGQLKRQAVKYNANPFQAFAKPYRSEESL